MRVGACLQGVPYTRPDFGRALKVAVEQGLAAYYHVYAMPKKFVPQSRTPRSRREVKPPISKDLAREAVASAKCVAENTAKVIYNASNEPAPFDHDAGWWVVPCFEHFLATVAEASATNGGLQLLFGDD